MDESEYGSEYVEWLKFASPDDWHRVVLSFQWAEKYDPLMWIVQQDDCDKATALTVFWRCCPEIGDAETVRASRSENWLSDNEIVEYIANRLNGRGYSRTEIAFDREPIMLDDYAGFERDISEVKDPLWRPHPDMIRPISGREVVPDRDFFRRGEKFFGEEFSEFPINNLIRSNINISRHEVELILFNFSFIGVSLGMFMFAKW